VKSRLLPSTLRTGGDEALEVSTIVLIAVATGAALSLVWTLAGIPALALALVALRYRSRVDVTRLVPRIGWIILMALVISNAIVAVAAFALSF